MRENPQRPKVFATTAVVLSLMQYESCSILNLDKHIYTLVGLMLAVSALLGFVGVALWPRLRRNRDSGRDVIGIFRKPEK